MDYMTFEQVVMLAQLIVAVLGLGVATMTLILGIVWKFLAISQNHKKNKK